MGGAYDAEHYFVYFCEDPSESRGDGSLSGESALNPRRLCSSRQPGLFAMALRFYVIPFVGRRQPWKIRLA